MLRCEDCGHVFEEGESKVVSESHGFENGSFEESYVCPVCGGSFDEVKPCKVCGTYEHDFREDYCESCIDSVKKHFKEVLFENFYLNEIDLLVDLEVLPNDVKDLQ